MSLLIWNKMYMVGITEFDEQHKKLIVLINKLYDAMKEGDGKKVLKDILNELIEYAKYHFKSEEKYFVEFNYPEKAEHVEGHNYFRKSVSDLKNRSDEGKPVFTMELMTFLKQWLVIHSMDSDKKYGKFLNEKGVY